MNISLCGLSAPLLNAAGLQALLNLIQRSLRDSMSDLINILASNDSPKSRRDEVVRHGKEPSSNETSTGIVRGERGDGERRLAMSVQLCVESAHGEDGHVACAELVADDALGAVLGHHASLGDHFGDDGAIEDDKELGGAVVDVQGCHAAG